jgi:nucleoside-diphosphate-sugar epimerase
MRRFPMRVLFIGGTGNISRPCVLEALRQNIEVFVFQRGRSAHPVPGGASSIQGDYADQEGSRRALRGLRFDAVAQFIAFSPEQARADVELWAGRTDQYLFVSSASVYHKPPSTPWITESTPLHNPFWQYARDKIACEEVMRAAYRERGFPATVVRPSHTYGESWIPTSLGSRDYTVARRIVEGKPIVVHGDGTSLWTLTHAEDFARGFVGLLGNQRAVGEAFHITSDELLSWDQIHRILAGALGREAEIVHVPSESIAARLPERGASLLGDKAHSMIYDNTKIRRFVPGFGASIAFHSGIRRSLAWYDEEPSRKTVDPRLDAEIDALVELWRRAGSPSAAPPA